MDSRPLANRKILLIVGGGIAAYKALELVRLIAKAGGQTRVILTESGAEFVTPLSLAALSGHPVRSGLFHPDDETSMGHIELSRWADLVVVAPATAGLIAKAANGLADDLASTTLIATDKRVLLAPAMNVRMWEHPAVQANMERLKAFPGFHGVAVVGPDDGEMACGEYGPGRMAEPAAILDAILGLLAGAAGRPLAGRKAVVTEMQAATQNALPADIAVLSAAVADWRVDTIAGGKIKKGPGGPPTLALIENPDILAGIAAPGPNRPALVIGFAAETTDLEANARAKLSRKGCDWIIGNDVSDDVFGSDGNAVLLVTADRTETWPRQSKSAIARAVAARIADHFKSAQ